MTDDLLERATRALRETSAEPQPKSGLTRARILEGAEKRAVRRRGGWLRWFVGIGVALGASTALARVAQQYWPEIQRAIAPAAEVREATPARPKKKVAPKPAEPPPQLAAAEPEVPPPAPPPTVAPVEPPPAATPPTPKRARPPKPRPTPAPAPEALAAPAPAPAPAESAELSLFRRAQRLHDAKDPAALGAWDDYLRVAARGVLVPEARYNRALCLVRAGKKEAARTALEPFARGDYGDYRRREAQALLDALAGKVR